MTKKREKTEDDFSNLLWNSLWGFIKGKSVYLDDTEFFVIMLKRFGLYSIPENWIVSLSSKDGKHKALPLTDLQIVSPDQFAEIVREIERQRDNGR